MPRQLVRNFDIDQPKFLLSSTLGIPLFFFPPCGLDEFLETFDFPGARQVS